MVATVCCRFFIQIFGCVPGQGRREHALKGSFQGQLNSSIHGCGCEMRLVGAYRLRMRRLARCFPNSFRQGHGRLAEDRPVLLWRQGSISPDKPALTPISFVQREVSHAIQLSIQRLVSSG